MDIRAGQWRLRLDRMTAAEGALALRAAVFRRGQSDVDAHDVRARHLWVEDPTGTVVGCGRLTVLEGAEIDAGYTAQFYELAGFAAAFPRAVEVGRMCLSPGLESPDVPRLLLAALTRVVDVERAAALFGCASFPMGSAALGPLADHVAPGDWAPGRRADRVRRLTGEGPLPPLLRAYLGLGARVSDHGVEDADLGTVHVFTALPTRAVPPGRARLLSRMLDGVS